MCCIESNSTQRRFPLFLTSCVVQVEFDLFSSERNGFDVLFKHRRSVFLFEHTRKRAFLKNVITKTHLDRSSEALKFENLKQCLSLVTLFANALSKSSVLRHALMSRFLLYVLLLPLENPLWRKPSEEMFSRSLRPPLSQF